MCRLHRGFFDDSMRMIRDIQHATRNTTQVLLFSATFNPEVKQFASRAVPNANQARDPP